MFLIFLGVVAASAALVGTVAAIDAAGDTADYQDASIALDEQAAIDAAAALAWEKEQALIANNAMLTGMQGDLSMMEIQYAEAQEKLSTYERALARFPESMERQKTATFEAGKDQFNQLMSNYENTAAVMAATGRSGPGGSGAIATGQAENKVAAYAGMDLIYNAADPATGEVAGGGLFADQYNELNADLNEQLYEISGQVDLYSETTSILEAGITTQQAAIGDLQAVIDAATPA